MKKNKYIYRLIHWSLTVFTIIYIITGFGITNYQIVTPMTLGFLSKPLCFTLHTLLIYPFIILIFLHIFLTLFRKRLIHHE